MGWVYMENCLAAAALNGVDRRSLQRSARLGQEVLERAKRRAVDWPSLEFPKGSVGVISQERPYGERWPTAGPERLLLGEREERRPTLSASFRTMAEFMDYTSSQCGVIFKYIEGMWKAGQPKFKEIASMEGILYGLRITTDSGSLPALTICDSYMGKYYSSAPEEGGAIHVFRYHRKKSQLHSCSDLGSGQSKTTSLGFGGSYQAPGGIPEASLPADNISKDLYIEVYPGTYSVTVGANDLTKTQVVAVGSGQSVDLVFPI